MDRERLKAEILTPDYRELADAALYAALALKDQVRYVPITSAALLAWAGGGADDDGAGIPCRLLRLKAAAASHPSRIVQGACLAACLMLERDGTQLDLSDPVRAGMLTALVAGGVLTALEAEDLQAMGAVMVSRLDLLNCSDVNYAQFLEFRRDEMDAEARRVAEEGGG